MPELPEVETVVRVLKKTWPLFPIEKIDVLHSKMVTPSLKALENALLNATLESIERIGKHIILIFNNDTVIISHLRMEGKYFVINPFDALPRFSRLILTFTNGQRLVYDDMRKFGTWIVSNKKDYKSHKSIQKLGVEPFLLQDNSLLYPKFKTRSQPIKTVLLDQSLLLGIGNIYADEILFASKIHPLTPAFTLSSNDIDQLLLNASKILLNAIEAGGSYVRSYRAGDSIDGSFQLQIHAYNRHRLPCHQCGFLMKKIMVAGRGTTYCPRCQTLPKKTKLIAITGPIATGKSIVMHRIKEQGFPVLFSDVIVKQFYLKKQHHASLKKIFGPTVIVNQTVDTFFILQQCVHASSLLTKLEALIHPYVEKEIMSALKRTKSRYLFVEIPLLFQAQLDYLTDHILYIKANRTIQTERVNVRNKDKGPLLLLLNEKKYDKDYSQLADTVIVNETTESVFKDKINTWLASWTKDQTLPEVR
jgi:formamidopyrimidine-DNA glycosylase